MRLEVSLAQKLSLQLKLAPQIIQSIEILQLPALSLQELVEQALAENEALERDDDARVQVESEVAPPERDNGQGAEAQHEAEAVADTLERLERLNAGLDPDSENSQSDSETLDRLERLEAAAERDWQDFGMRRGGGGDDDPTSLAATLYDQFVLLEPDEDERTLGRHIIFNLKEDGLVAYPLEEILLSPELRGRFTLEEAERVLKMVQKLEPRGVGARNLQEALLLQLDPEDPDQDLKRRIIEDHLLDVNKNKLPKVARELDITIPQLKKLVDSIIRLDPRPGAKIGSDRNAYVHPDVIVEWIDGRYEIRLEETFFPRIRVNPQYREMLTKSDDPKVKDWVRKKLENAKWLVDAIQQRQNTLYRVCEEIFKVQRDYLDFGETHLHPLKMQEIADRVGIHVSTVSRAIADKWVQTPRGIVPLKFFFTGGAETADGETMSRLSVKQMVKEIVDGEDKRSPLSDEQVAERLKEQGLDIARRTVTKYRKALQIPSSRQRRQWE
ncbi:MAG: RNA polymerase factor sigma-54 [Planctomycetota bacterium]|jgi:RNA polymerase sigma-54 factor